MEYLHEAFACTCLPSDDCSSTHTNHHCGIAQLRCEVRNEATGVQDDQVALLGWLAVICWASFTKLCVNVCSFLHHLGSK